MTSFSFYLGSIWFCDEIFDSRIVFKLVHVVPVLQEEDDQSAHVRPVYQEVRCESVTADDVIFATGFRIRKNPGFTFLADVTVGAFSLENVKLNLSFEPEISNFHFGHSNKQRKREKDIKERENERKKVKKKERERERKTSKRERERERRQLWYNNKFKNMSFSFGVEKSTTN